MARQGEVLLETLGRGDEHTGPMKGLNVLGRPKVFQFYYARITGILSNRSEDDVPVLKKRLLS